MAGIGFQLRKMLDEGNYLSYLKCFGYGVIISSGPWLVTVFTLNVIVFLSKPYLTIDQLLFFIMTILYIFCFSLILTGPFQLILSRYIADQFFFEKREKIPPAAATLLLLTAALSLAVSVPFFLPLETSINIENLLLYKISAIILFVSLGSVWLMMSFITCLRKFKAAFIIFLLGSFVCFAGAVILREQFGIEGILSGYTLGIIVIALLLWRLLLREFPVSPRFNKLSMEALSYIPKFASIGLIGLFYNAGMWSDKVLNWILIGERIAGSRFYAFPSYDFPLFLAYLTMIPGLTYFLIGTETAIMDRYKHFLVNLRKSPFLEIKESKEKLMESLRFGFRSVIKFQVIVSLAVFISAEAIFRFLHWNFISIVLFRVFLGAAFFQVLLFITMIFLLYFEFRKEALLMTLIFFITNLTLSWICISLGENYYGWGYLLSAFISSIIGIFLFFNKVKNIDFHIFSS